MDILREASIAADGFSIEVLEKKLNVIWATYRLEEALKGPWTYVFGLSLSWPQLIKPVFSMERKGDLNKFELSPAMARLMIQRQKVEFLEATKRYKQEKTYIETVNPRLKSLKLNMDNYVLALEEGLNQIKKVTEADGLPPNFIINYSDKLAQAKEARDSVLNIVNRDMVYYESRLRNLDRIIISQHPKKKVKTYHLNEVIKDVISESEEVGDLALAQVDVDDARLKLWEARGKPPILIKRFTPYLIFDSGDCQVNGNFSFQVKGPGWRYLIEFLELDVLIEELEVEY